MARIKCMVAAAVYMVTFAVVKANQCSSGGGCPGGNKPNNVLSMLQTKLQMNALKDEGGQEMPPSSLLPPLSSLLPPPSSLLRAAERGAGLEGAEMKAAANSQQRGAQLLYDPEHGVVVGYAPRAASSLMVDLFLFSIDELGNAVSEGERSGVFKPHYFVDHYLSPRYYVPQQVLCQGSQVAQATSVTTSLKLVANPYVRAVSSFIHQMQTAITGKCVPHSNTPIHPMCSQLNISGAAEGAGSFRYPEDLMANVTFIQWLESVKKVGFGALDGHTRPQVSQMESESGCGFDHICKLDGDLQACLGEVNAKSGANFSVAGLNQFMSQQNSTVNLVHAHEAKGAFNGTEEVARLPLARLRALDSEPVTSDWYQGDAGERATELVKELFQVDFAMYGYEQ